MEVKLEETVMAGTVQYSTGDRAAVRQVQLGPGQMLDPVVGIREARPSMVIVCATRAGSLLLLPWSGPPSRREVPGLLGIHTDPTTGTVFFLRTGDTNTLHLCRVT